MNAVKQMPLPLRFPAEQRFERFLPVGAPEPSLLRSAIDNGERVYVSGPSGSGKSHLLLASAAEADATGRQVAYLSLTALAEHAAAMLDAQPALNLICIDDLDHAAGSADVERALFALHNRQGDAGGTLIYAARHAPDSIAVALPDLRSRLGHCLRLTPRALDDAQRRQLLTNRAEARGLVLEDAALDYLFRRVDRDLSSLTTLIDRLDRESLAAQRRLTVPFLRDVLERR